MDHWRHRIRQALAVEWDYDHRRFEPQFQDAGAQAAAVLLLLKPLGINDAEILLTRRTDTVDHHKGQIAFPGGRTDPEDVDPADPGQTALTTALREAEEEVGLQRQRVEILGKLPTMLTITRYQVVPVVGMLRDPTLPTELVLQEGETAEAFWAPLSVLRAPGVYRQEPRDFRGQQVITHVYQVGPHRVWGATGAMIRNFLERLDRLPR